MIVRSEDRNDIFRVYAVNRAAFETLAEARLVDRLREEAGPVVSQVAEIEGEIVGHILFTPVTLDDHPELPLVGLGPMAVHPDHQRQGIGSALVEAGLAACREIGAAGVVVLGHPEFYPRFGFVPASQFGIGCEYDVPEEAFMATELIPNAFDGSSGTVRYHDAFAAW
ncbi:MAG: N-acetyltransferase [Planctomycetaceae bacterium]|nr:N-acetyltransferase [Planctomycetaceae bacterium]